MADGTTVGQLFDDLVAQHPRLERMRPATMLMVNKAYVPPDDVLQNGDEVALIPPVSGGERGTFWRSVRRHSTPGQVESLRHRPGCRRNRHFCRHRRRSRPRPTRGAARL